MFYYLNTLYNDLSESQQRYDDFFATPLRQDALSEETVVPERMAVPTKNRRQLGRIRSRKENHMRVKNNPS